MENVFIKYKYINAIIITNLNYVLLILIFNLFY